MVAPCKRWRATVDLISGSRVLPFVGSAAPELGMFHLTIGRAGGLLVTTLARAAFQTL